MPRGRNYQLAVVHRYSLVAEPPEGLKINVPFTELEQI